MAAEPDAPEQVPDDSGARPTASIFDWLHIPTLRLLVAVADAGSLSAGARDEGVAQSNASRSIALLERRLGYQLIQRSASGSRPTPKGMLTVEWARKVLAAADQMDRAVAALGAHQASAEVFRVGASMTVAEFLAPEWIRQLTVDVPGVHPVLEISNSQGVIDKVHNGALPLGFVETPDIPRDLRSALIARDELVIVVAPGHPWAQLQGGISVAELAARSLIEREPGSGTRAAFDTLLADRLPDGGRAEPIAELNSNAAIINSVRAGLGPAVLSELAVRQALAHGQVLKVPLADRPVIRDLRAVWFGVREPLGVARSLLRIAARHQG